MTDLSLAKNLVLVGRTQLQVRAELFNAFNTVNWSSPNTNIQSTNFGRITGAGACARWSWEGRCCSDEVASSFQLPASRHKTLGAGSWELNLSRAEAHLDRDPDADGLAVFLPG